jgi:hypothetical protein
MMDRLESALNFVNDLDSTWWPFALFLRPRLNEKMSNTRVLAIAALYGVFAGMLVNAALALTHEQVGSVMTFPLSTTFGFFTIYRLTFAVAWNRRASRCSLRADSP